MSSPSPVNGSQGRQASPPNAPNGMLNSGNNNPLMMYLQQAQQNQGGQQQQQQYSQSEIPSINGMSQHQAFTSAQAQAAFYSADSSPQGLTPSLHPTGPSHSSSASFSMANGNGMNGSSNGMNGSTTVGGMLAPSNMGQRGAQHSRAVSLPVFTQAQQLPPPIAQHNQQMSNGFGGMSNGGYGGFSNGIAGYGLAISGDNGQNGHGGLPGWAEEEIGAH